MSSENRSHDDIDSRLERLEARLDEQAEIIERQRDYLDEQAELIEQQRERIAELEADDEGAVIMSRRTALQAGGILGLIGVGAGAASADAQGSVGTSSDPLGTLYAEELNGGVTNDQSLTDLEGSGLSISSGTLNASGAGAWTDGDAADLLEPDGSKVGVEVDKIADDGSGDVTLESSLDAAGNDIRLTEDIDLVMEPGLDAVEFRDTNNGHTTFQVTTGDPGTVFLRNADIAVDNSNGIVDNFGDHHLTINSGGPLGVDKNLNFSNPDSIQAAGTDAIQFDGSQNVTVANGTLDLNSNEITNVGTVNGVSISNHASRHSPSGADALTTQSPVTLGTSNAEGTADAFARADHVHAHGPLGSETTNGNPLHSLATASTPGFLSSGDKSKLNNLASDASSAYVDSTGDTMTGGLTLDGSTLEFSNGAGIRDSGTDAVQFDGSANVTVANGSLDLSGGDLEDGGLTIWDTLAGYIPTARLQNDSVTVTAGDGLKNGGSVSLGGSTTLDVEPADFAGTGLSDDGSDNLTANLGDGLEGDGSDNIRVSGSAIAGNVLAENVSNPYQVDVNIGGSLTNNSGTLGLATDGVTGTEIDLSTIAGQNITADTTNNELDGATPALDDGDSDTLLEPTGNGINGIDVSTVQATNLNDTGGNAHLTLNDGGTLDLNRTLDTNGNGIQSDTSVSVDIDANNDATSETFTVTKDGGGTTLLTVNESGEVDVNSGSLDLNGNDLTSVNSINGSVTTSQITQLDGSGLTVNSGSLATAYAGTAVHLSTDQTLSSADSDITVQFDTEGFDTGGNFDTTNYEFTAPQDGFYSVNAQVTVDRQETNDYIVKLLVNGTTPPGAQVRCTNTEKNASIGRTLQLTSGDTVSVVVKLEGSVSSDVIRAESNLSIDFEGQ